MRILAIAKKETHHILRDSFTLVMSIILPLILVIIFGPALNFTPKDINISILDNDQTTSSRSLIANFTYADYFIPTIVHSATSATNNIDSEISSVAIIINQGLEKSIDKNDPFNIQILLDGADNSSAGIIVAFLAGVENSFNRQLQNREKSPLQIKSRFVFNPELESTWFIIPGLIVVILAILSILLTALTLAREWENGSMELLLSTPVHPLEIIIGKILPYTVLGIMAVFLIYLVATLFMGVPFVGNLALFFFGCILFLGTYLSLGIVISATLKQQQLAMQAALVIGLLPSTLISGFIFPIESMPLFFQYLTYILPARWFMLISRGIFIQGASFEQLLLPFSMLILLNLLLIKVALKKFRRSLE